MLLQAIGVDLDLSDKGLGLRSRRYTMLIDDGVVSILLCPLSPTLQVHLLRVHAPRPCC